jgi:hypothetical protein
MENESAKRLRDMASHLEKVIATPIDDLTREDFLKLKVGGRDKFSNIRRSMLKYETQAITYHVEGDVNKVFPNPENQVACLRWICRGLSPQKAIRKIKIENEEIAKMKKRYFEKEEVYKQQNNRKIDIRAKRTEEEMNGHFIRFMER